MVMTIGMEALWPLIAAPLSAQALGPRPLPVSEEPTDEELIGRAQGGDPKAMQAIYQRHASLAYRRLTHLVGPDAEREDLLQEVFIALFARLEAFRGDASLRTYLMGIVAHKAYDHLKRRARMAKRQVLTDAAGEEESRAPSPERTTQDRRDQELLWRCLDRLKPKKRIAFVLRVVEGQSLKEIAEQVGASVPTVAQRIRHAKLELVQMVREHEEQDPEQEDGP